MPIRPVEGEHDPTIFRPITKTRVLQCLSEMGFVYDPAYDRWERQSDGAWVGSEMIDHDGTWLMRLHLTILGRGHAATRTTARWDGDAVVISIEPTERR